ncbi:MAG TPA: hypothetical protein VFQ38_05065 [Longimicrobiales bacterium]|nr:hypothetical protein [Longimicrobiales bacterium]
MRPRLAASLVAALAVLGGAGPAAAQCAGGSCDASLSMTVGDVMRLTLNGANTALGTPVEADFTAGYRDATGPVATVRCNRACMVTLLGATATFGYAGTLPNPNKPAADLRWGTTNGAYPNTLGSAATVYSGAATDGTARPLFYRTLWSFSSDVPGTYTLVASFTISAP